MTEQSKRTGIVLVVVATVGLALKGIWARLAYAEGLDVTGVVFYRAALAAPLSLVMGLWLRKRFQASQARLVEKYPGDWLRAALLGAFFSLGMWCDFQAIAQLGAGLSRVILFGFPLVVLMIDAVLARAWPSRHRLIGFGVAWVGLLTVALGRSTAAHSAVSTAGLLWAFASLFLYAIYVWCSGKLAPRMGSVQLTMVSQWATAAVVVVAVLATDSGGGGGVIPAISSEALGWVALMVVVSTIGPYFLLTEGIARLGASRAGLLAMFGPTVTLLAGAIVLGESLTTAQWLGTVATLFGVKWSQSQRGGLTWFSSRVIPFDSSCPEGKNRG